ncbi:hypothetical protein ACLQ2S_24890 [Micromonospora sp. DT48]|uniref:hypothetical protein n=1 Tax=Micromonospora sp. DT48 TaxID=3393429 RepID=UPI003CEBB3BA
MASRGIPKPSSDRFDHLIAKAGLPPRTATRPAPLRRHLPAPRRRRHEEVRETLGHSTIGPTSDTYTSVIIELERGTADAAADLIPRNDSAA